MSGADTLPLADYADVDQDLSVLRQFANSARHEIENRKREIADLKAERSRWLKEKVGLLRLLGRWGAVIKSVQALVQDVEVPECD